jgi:predicted permease
MPELLRDLRHVLRALWRAPLFSVVAVTTLALGIGVGSTLFSFVDAALLRPLPVERPDELFAVFSSWPGEAYSTSSLPDLRDLQAGVGGAELFGHATALAVVQEGGRSRMLVGAMVTGDAFRILGIGAAAGRLLQPADDAGPGAPRVVVVGHDFWRRQLGGDPAAVGRVLRLNGYPYEVVGVAPAGFHGLMPGLVANFFVPAVRVDEIDAAGQIHSLPGDAAASLRERRGYRWLWVTGRLEPGGSQARVEAEAAAVMSRLAAEHPLTNDRRRVVVTAPGDVRLHPDVDRIVTAAAVVLLGSVALLVVVVSANLANMVLSRALARQRDVAIRLALGSGPGRVLRQLLLESLVVSLAGAAAGLLVARLATAWLLRAMPPLPIEIGLSVGTDLRVAAFAVALGTLSALVCGLLPVRQTLRRDLVADLRDGARTSEGPARAWSLRNLLVVSQVALSMVLLVAATLLVRSLLHARAAEVGIDAGRIAAVAVDVSLAGFDDARAAAFLERLRDAAAAEPDVAAAALATRVPLDVNVHFVELYPEGGAIRPGEQGIATDTTAVDPGYFAALGVPLVAGRGFDGRDAAGTPATAVVNQEMARRHWGSAQAALGRTLRVGRVDAPPTTVVGVVGDHKVRAVAEAQRPLVHFALAQQPSRHVYLLARSRGADAAQLAERLRRLALTIDPDAAVPQTTTLAGFAAVSLYPVRTAATLLAAFAALALGLASVGLYGVIAYSVARRQREMGIRLAVGADRRDLVRLVVARGMRLLGGGLLAGAVLAALATRLLGGVLHGVGALDPVSFLSAAAVLATAGWLANAVPAARAAATDPAVVLRGE